MGFHPLHSSLQHRTSDPLVICTPSLLASQLGSELLLSSRHLIRKREGKGQGRLERGQEENYGRGMCQRRRSLNSALGCCSFHAVMQPGCISWLDSPHLPDPTWEKVGNGDAISSPSNPEVDKKQISVPSLPQTSSHFSHPIHLPNTFPSSFPGLSSLLPPSPQPTLGWLQVYHIHHTPLTHEELYPSDVELPSTWSF